jgi:GT2 family glycosyltransferase
MPTPLVTVITVPRERFSYTKESLESLYENTGLHFDHVYVDCGSPDNIRSYLESKARSRGFKLIRKNNYLSPNRARNIGLKEAHGKYIAFTDNDLIVWPAWLEKLVQCAEETDAWLVGPIYCVKETRGLSVHMAGGIVRIEERQGMRHLFEQHTLTGIPPEHITGRLKRLPCDLIEFHCMLVRSDVFDKLGPLDESLLSNYEHIDLCLAVRNAGGEVYLEPESIVTYVAAPPFQLYDLPFYFERWSDLWHKVSTEHFCKKWDLDKKDTYFINSNKWARQHRQNILMPLKSFLGRFFGFRIANRLVNLFFSPIEILVNRIYIRNSGIKKFFRFVAANSGSYESHENR